MPAPKRHRGHGMRYSTPLPSYLPLGGRDESITRSIKHRCQTYTDPRTILPSQLSVNPVASLVPCPTPPPPPQISLENPSFPVNYIHPVARNNQHRIGRPVTSWPARPGAADYFGTAQLVFTQTPRSPQTGPVHPQMSPALVAATGHPCNPSEAAVAIIASVPAAVDSLSLPQAPLFNIPAHHPNEANPRLRAVWQLPNHLRYLPISPMPPSRSFRSSDHFVPQSMPEETTGATSRSGKPHKPTRSWSLGGRGHKKASERKRRQRRSRAVTSAL